MKRFHTFTTWLAIVALLAAGLLPAAASIAAPAVTAAPRTVLCGALAGPTQPAKPASAASVHHCVLCGLCAAGLLPARPDGATATPVLAGEADLASRPSTAPLARRARLGAQPRAPPVIAS